MDEACDGSEDVDANGKAGLVPWEGREGSFCFGFSLGYSGLGDVFSGSGLGDGTKGVLAPEPALAAGTAAFLAASV